MIPNTDYWWWMENKKCCICEIFWCWLRKVEWVWFEKVDNNLLFNRNMTPINLIDLGEEILITLAISRSHKYFFWNKSYAFLMRQHRISPDAMFPNLLIRFPIRIYEFWIKNNQMICNIIRNLFRITLSIEMKESVFHFPCAIKWNYNALLSNDVHMRNETNVPYWNWNTAYAIV